MVSSLIFRELQGMSQNNVEISKESIKLPYERFLADGAGGYALALVCLIAYLINAPIPFSSYSWQDVLPIAIIDQFKLPIGLLVFLLGTPLGLFLNAISWFLLGSLQIRFVDAWANSHKFLAFLTFSTTRAYHVEILQDCFHFKSTNPKLEKRSLLEQATLFEEVLPIYYPAMWASLTHVYGIKQFTRNLALIAACVFVYSALVLALFTVIFAFVAVILLIVLTSLIEFYHSLATLFKVYLLCRKNWTVEELKSQSIESILEYLLSGCPQLN